MKMLRLVVSFCFLTAWLLWGCATAPKPGTLASSVDQTLSEFAISATEPQAKYREDNLWEHMNGGSHQVIVLGFVDLHVARYEDPSGDGLYLVEQFRMKNDEGARQLFSLWQTDTGTGGEFCGRSFSEDGFLSFQKGKSYVRITQYAPSQATPERIEALGRELCREIESQTP
jgi:Family of unknown function (DUF6599)